jgi:hypothetical protein
VGALGEGLGEGESCGCGCLGAEEIRRAAGGGLVAVEGCLTAGVRPRAAVEVVRVVDRDEAGAADEAGLRGV